MAALVPTRSRLKRAVLLGIVASLFLALSSTAVAQAFNEYQVKAVFLFNFGQFVEWMSRAGSGTSAPFVIGVLGDDPFDGFLDETVRGENIGGRPIVVQRYRKSEEIAGCDILFVSDSEAHRLPQILDAVQGRNILTVSDVENFAQRGGIVQFVTEKRKIKLKINVDAAKAANLSISSKLLRPATIVTSERG
jgi:hypothetical protein